MTSEGAALPASDPTPAYTGVMRKSATGRKPVIGLLGGPGSGKSLVAQQMAEMGCAVVDADAIARAQLDEPAVRAELASWWGERILRPDGRVDRKAVGRIVFEDASQRRRLEALVHPRVGERRRRLHKQYQADPDVVAIVEDCPLLLETGLDAECDALVYVDAPRSVRLSRVSAERGWTEADLAARENAQASLDIKRSRADDVVVNDAGEAECRDRVRRVLSRILPALS